MPNDDAEKTDDANAPTSDAESFDAVGAAAELAAAMKRRPAPEADANPTNYTAILEDEVEALQRVVAEKEEALQAALEKAAQAKAEVDRARARLERDAAATIGRKQRDVVASFLDVADDLGRAAAELTGNGVNTALAQGVLMVASKLQTVLGRHGAVHRPALGLPFDSAHHEAIGTVPATDEVPEGTVASVVQEGYVIGDHTLRVARVVVAR